MANTSSAKKANRASVNKKASNQEVKDKVHAARKTLEKATTAAKKATALKTFYKVVDKAAKKSVNVLSENKAARLKSNAAKIVA